MNASERTATRASAAPLAARYRSLFEIGRGGMGTIEVALERGDASANESAWSRVVALKRMHPHARERRHVEMFLREARLAQWLVHPNVVHTFDFGESEGELFLAMEYVEGETLSAIVKRARDRTATGLPAVIVATIIAAACEGLHAAHELLDPTSGAPLNVIHRDVSPHNVMVSYEGHVKLLDFGVAKMDSVDPLTRTGEVKGKTAYMSPEQALGEPVDRRSDLFALGAVLFECIAGEKMWGSGTDVEVMRRLALESPPALEQAAPHAPKPLCEVVARLVARAPQQRPATALDVARELRMFAARASAHEVDASAIATMMASLFATEAAQRKQLLNEAIRSAAPASRVDVLRRSLAGPTALAALTPPRPPRSVPPPSVRTVSERPPESTSPPATKTGLIVSVIVGLLIAAAIVVGARMRSAKPGPSPAPVAASAPAPGSVSVPPSVSVPAPLSGSVPASVPAPVPAPPPASSSGSTKKKKPLDVDPNPL